MPGIYCTVRETEGKEEIKQGIWKEGGIYPKWLLICSRSHVWEAGRKKKHSHFILVFNEGQTHCIIKGKTSDVLLLLLIQTQKICLKSFLSQYSWPPRLFNEKKKQLNQTS